MAEDTSATVQFFEQLDRRRHEPLLEKMAGSIRFDLHKEAHTEHWMLIIKRGDVRVSREDRVADCVVNTSPELFDGMVRGEVNAISASLRGALTVVGNALLILRFARLFPAPPGSLGPRRVFREEVRP